MSQRDLKKDNSDNNTLDMWNNFLVELITLFKDEKIR